MNSVVLRTLSIDFDDGKKHYSRDGQDRFAIDHIFHRKRGGYFLDIGASDGVSENNTYLFESCYDWNGICCECDARDINLLCQNRKRHIVSSPIYKTSGELINFEMHPANHLSGISGFQVEKYRNTNSKVVYMMTLSLNDCLKKFDAPNVIDYMTLDTEGTEYEILSAFDFNKYKINYMAIEHNSQHPKRENIRSLLENNGYAYFRSIAQDDDYILKEYATKNGIKIN